MLVWAVLKLVAKLSAINTGERSSSMASVRTVRLICQKPMHLWTMTHVYVNGDCCGYLR